MVLLAVGSVALAARTHLPKKKLGDIVLSEDGRAANEPTVGTESSRARRMNIGSLWLSDQVCQNAITIC